MVSGDLFLIRSFLSHDTWGRGVLTTILILPVFFVRVECDVTEYGGVEGSMRGLHRVRYADGLCEWIALKRFRLLMSGIRFARSVHVKGKVRKLRSGDGSKRDVAQERW